MVNFQRVSLGALALFVATPFIYFGGLYYTSVTSRVILWCGALLAALITTIVLVHRDQELKKSFVNTLVHPVSVSFFAWCLWLLVRSAPHSFFDAWWGTLERSDGMFFYFGLWFFMVCIAACARRYGQIFSLTPARVYVGVLTVTTAIAALTIMITSGSVFNERRFVGSVGNAWYLAGLLIFVPWSLSFVRSRWIQTTVLIVAAYALYESLARSVYIGFAAGLVVFVCTYRNFSRRVRVAAISIFVVTILVCAALFSTGVVSTDRISTIFTRFAMWKAGTHELAARPIIGFGVGGHLDAIDRGLLELKQVEYSDLADTTHSAYLDIALKGGVIALVLFGLFMVCLLRAVWKSDVWKNEFQRAVAIATIVAYGVAIATGLVALWHLIPLALIAGFAMSSSRTALPASASRFFPMIGWIGAGLMIASTVVMIGYTVFAAYTVGRVERAFATRVYSNLPQRSPSIATLYPYARDYFIAQLRFSLPSTERAVVPSYQRYVQNVLLPIVNTVHNHEALLYPHQRYVLASWIFSYVQSGLTADHALWLSRASGIHERELARNPERPQNVFQLADIYRTGGESDRAVELLRVYAEGHPDFAEAQFYYAVMLELVGKTSLVRAQIERAMQARPNLEDWGIEQRAWIREHLVTPKK